MEIKTDYRPVISAACNLLEDIYFSAQFTDEDFRIEDRIVFTQEEFDKLLEGLNSLFNEVDDKVND